MSDDKDLTSAGVPWNEVPEFARHQVEWMDGRHGPAQDRLPSVEVLPVSFPKISSAQIRAMRQNQRIIRRHAEAIAAIDLYRSDADL
jgi:hypothetical protein